MSVVKEMGLARATKKRRGSEKFPAEGKKSKIAGVRRSGTIGR